MTRVLGEVPVPGPDHGGSLPSPSVEFLESVHNLVHVRMCMASKITYWKCVDCNSMINDENMHEFDEDLEIELDDGSTLQCSMRSSATDA